MPEFSSASDESSDEEDSWARSGAPSVRSSTTEASVVPLLKAVPGALVRRDTPVVVELTQEEKEEEEAREEEEREDMALADEESMAQEAPIRAMLAEIQRMQDELVSSRELKVKDSFPHPCSGCTLRLLAVHEHALASLATWLFP